jgi:MFS superfamily sulfate permease-like transporter
MQIYWSIKQIPELANLTPEQQKQAWQACYKKYALKSWPSWVLLGVMATLIIVCSRYFGPILGGAIGGGVGGGLWGLTLTNTLRPHLKTYVEQNF